jgi:hypothetical protein
MATFGPVRGTCVGSWCQRWIARDLRGAGHAVHHPTRTGYGERVHLSSHQIDLDTHSALSSP